MPKLVFLDTESLDCGDIDFSELKGLCAEVECWPQTSKDQCAQRIQSAEIVVSNKVILNETVINSAKYLKLICIAATGTNNVDLQFAKQQGIQVCNVTAYATASVVQHVFAMLTSLQGRLVTQQRSVISKQWSRSDNFCILDYPFSELQGKTIGIIGYGELGKAVANVAKSFGMKVLLAQRPYNLDQAMNLNQEIPPKQYSEPVKVNILSQDYHLTQSDTDKQCSDLTQCLDSDRVNEVSHRGDLSQSNESAQKQFPSSDNNNVSKVPLSDLLERSDVVTLHCPLVEETRGLIGADAFNSMKSSALLINTARGGIVNEIDLLVALKSGSIAGAALDVLENEPPPENHPLFAYQEPNLIITPHIAWSSRESRQRLVDQLVNNVRSYFDGDLLNSVL
ncbi:D-3-phosphoglycerate dehydrogenase [hydrothermal vent metagenome]|uniref:D-3-phosphoglycerate dehydrogenase n=1 Tax=hydrothermal vent metagenome TaxID=652676 RepID=A0A3B0YY24_9ZZZZ